MNDSPILVPFAGMLLLTLVVWVVMFYRRITAIQALGVRPRTRADLELLGPAAVNASNNLQNLFELPVVFYACVLALLQTAQVDALHVACASGFFAFRIAHSAIHCTYNEVMHRFSVYAIASLFLWIMVVRLALASIVILSP
jgi:hypothetical protein